MKRIYLLPLAIFALGLGLIIASTSAGATLPILGLSVPVQVVRGVGLIAFIFSIVTSLAIYGSTLPPRQTRTLQTQERAMHDHSDDFSGHRHLSHRA